MSKPSLHLATEADAKLAAETVAERIQRLQREAKTLARDHVRGVVGALEQTVLSAAEIATGGPAYPDGLRQEMEQLAREVERRLQTIRAIAERAS